MRVLGVLIISLLILGIITPTVRLAKAQVSREEAEAKLKIAEDMLKTLQLKGFDVTQELEELQKAKESFERGDHALAIKNAEKIISKNAEKLRELAKEEPPQAVGLKAQISWYEDHLSGLEKIVGTDISELLNEAKEALAAGNASKCAKLLAEIRKTLIERVPKLRRTLKGLALGRYIDNIKKEIEKAKGEISKVFEEKPKELKEISGLFNETVSKIFRAKSLRKAFGHLMMIKSISMSIDAIREHVIKNREKIAPKLAEVKVQHSELMRIANMVEKFSEKFPELREAFSLTKRALEELRTAYANLLLGDYNSAAQHAELAIEYANRSNNVIAQLSLEPPAEHFARFLKRINDWIINAAQRILEEAGGEPPFKKVRIIGIIIEISPESTNETGEFLMRAVMWPPMLPLKRKIGVFPVPVWFTLVNVIYDKNTTIYGKLKEGKFTVVFGEIMEWGWAPTVKAEKIYTDVFHILKH